MTPFKNYPVTSQPPVVMTEPTIRLFVCNGQTNEPSEGQKRANAIRVSFKNPFQAFLPAKRPEEVTGKKSSEEINRQWKTKSEGAGGDGEVTTNDEEKTQKKRRRGDGSSEKDVDRVDDGEVSPKQQKKNKKKEEEKNKGDEVATEDDEETTKPRRQFGRRAGTRGRRRSEFETAEEKQEKERKEQR